LSHALAAKTRIIRRSPLVASFAVVFFTIQERNNAKSAMPSGSASR
jgi:hypothetical protein